jgi:magnesium chelatase family protein
MVIARVRSSTVSGLSGVPVDVEVRPRDGTKKKFVIIGLGDSAVRESAERVISALRSGKYEIPEETLVNLAPAELRKEGSAFDVPIAVGVLIATGVLPEQFGRELHFHGELALNGEVRPIRGVVALALAALHSEHRSIVVPYQNVTEALLVEGVRVFGIHRITDVIDIAYGNFPEARAEECASPSALSRPLYEVWGQERAKRALVIAAAGTHNLLMIGPPGCGKSMMAERFPSILPALSSEEKQEILRVHSIAGLPLERILQGERPVRAPHHLVSEVGLTGGAYRPGEISLAHRGVLFLDELPEFRRAAIEGLRAPLESGKVLISRAKGSWSYPARFQLLAAMNPCPCGRLGVKGASCLCSRGAIASYLSKISQPVLDRIDLHVELSAIPLEVLSEGGHAREGEDMYLKTDAVREQVMRARNLQLARFSTTNNEVSGELLRREGEFTLKAREMLEKIGTRIGLSARGFVRVMRVSRTIADLQESPQVTEEHVAEAASFRSLERLHRYCEARA